MKKAKTKEKKKRRITIKKVFFIVLAIYASYTLVEQQITLNYYRNQEKYYIQKINEEKEKAEKLEKLKLLYSTDMHIEKIARDKLGLVKQGEKIFIDIYKP